MVLRYLNNRLNALLVAFPAARRAIRLVVARGPLRTAEMSPSSRADQ